MEKTWRWFGKNDKITLPMLKQIGVEGIVTALHHISNGEIWSLEEVEDMKNYIESHGLRWSVVESLPVSESIKYAGPDRDELIEKYIVSLENLGKAGVHTICYNFMPVLDWARTDLAHDMGDGTAALYFDMVQFAYFDNYILEREGAAADYTAETLAKAAELDKVITDEEKQGLIDSIIVKTQGFVNGNIKEGDKAPVAIFKRLLAQYDGIDRDQLRANLKYFLERIMPVCNQYGMNMCIHPDDPPRQLLGLPRIVTSGEDIQWILDAVDDIHNGLTFCAGSLSAGIHNDVVALAEKFHPRVHFAHLRSTEVFPNGDFMEADHLKGRANLIDLVALLEAKRPDLPMRPDHGKLMLGDEEKGYNPGYSLLGRMYGLAQLDGLIAAARHMSHKC